MFYRNKLFSMLSVTLVWLFRKELMNTFLPLKPSVDRMIIIIIIIIIYSVLKPLIVAFDTSIRIVNKIH
jgi:uncharacterized membrane protein